MTTRSSVQVEMKGLEELRSDMAKAAKASPKKLQRSLNRIKNVFKKNMKTRAEETYDSTEYITSGFTMTQVKVAEEMLYSYFKPEARGNKGHAWHLQEHGYNLTRPQWKSREKMIRYSDGGEKLKWIPGHHLVDKEVPGFTAYMAEQAAKTIDRILKDEKL